VRGTLRKVGLAEGPPHPDRKSDPTSPRKRGEVKLGEASRAKVNWIASLLRFARNDGMICVYCGVMPEAFTTVVSFS
jgi:hypothetical protein